VCDGAAFGADARGEEGVADAGPPDCDALLKDIAAGRVLGPSPSLGQLYREQSRQEAALRAAFVEVLDRHPAWPWLSCVRGIGPTLAAQLLARLDLARAPHPSSFWAYCGLATVAATRWRCAACGAAVLVPEGRGVPASHLAGAGRGASAARGRSRAATTRAARASPSRATCAARRAPSIPGRSACATWWASRSHRQGGRYKAFLAARSARYEAERPDWSAQHRWFAALRVTEKLFLAHLWDRVARRGGAARRAAAVRRRRGIGDAPLDPWAMIDREREGVAGAPHADRRTWGARPAAAGREASPNARGAATAWSACGCQPDVVRSPLNPMAS
jgi:hypothetical protein